MRGPLPGGGAERSTADQTAGERAHWETVALSSGRWDTRVESMQGFQGFRGLSLRFRIAGGVLAGLVVLFSFFSFLAIRTINLSIDVALEERLRLEQISAASVR